MSNLTQLFDLLTEHGGTLSYNALAGLMNTNVKTVAATVMQAKIGGIARNLNKKGAGSGGMAQLYPNAAAPTASREVYQRSEGRGPVALALLAEHPEGLTQLRLSYLTTWSHGTVCRCMVALEHTGQVIVTGGTAQRPKTYTLPLDDAPRIAPVCGDHHEPYARHGKVLALLSDTPEGLPLLLIASKLNLSTRTLRPTVHELLALGKLVETVRNLSGHRTYALPQDAAAPRLPVSVQAPVRSDLGGELEAAYKILATLGNKTAKGLQHRGGYGPRQAQELFEQLQAGNWL